MSLLSKILPFIYRSLHIGKKWNISKLINKKNKLFEVGKVFSNIKILEVNSKLIIGASGYKIFKFINGRKYYFSELEDLKYGLLARCWVTRRLFRAEIQFFKSLKNNSGICIAKNGIFLLNKLSGRFEKVFQVARGSRPLNLCEDLEGNLFFGEYFNNKDRDQVHVYSSKDLGKTWDIVYTFETNTIRHIHAVQADPFTGYIWIVTGDNDGECIIAYTRDGFRTIDIVAQGGQEYRSCRLLFFRDFIVYGTDSPLMENYIIKMNRSDFSIEKLQKVQGSVINACQNENICLISTAVEPSTINRDRKVYLWYSENGYEWNQIFAVKKDLFNMTYFQFGNLCFPNYENAFLSSIYFSGQAVKTIDGTGIELKKIQA